MAKTSRERLFRENIFDKLDEQRQTFDIEYKDQNEMWFGSESDISCQKLNPEVAKAAECDEYFHERTRLTADDGEEILRAIARYEIKAEFEFRRRAIRDYISACGVAENTEDIIGGLNKTCGRVVDNSWMNIPLSLERSVEFIRIGGSALLNFGLDYVDKWKMYNSMNWDAAPTKRNDLFVKQKKKGK